MSATQDELAGVVDLFGALTRSELSDALVELAFKQGKTVKEDAFEQAIADAVEGYFLVEYEPTSEAVTEEPTTHTSAEPLLTVGPTAFPTLPPNAEDLPHILDYETRAVDRDVVATQVKTRLQTEAEQAVDADQPDRAAMLLDVSYDVDAWAAVETDAIRQSLAAVLPQD